MTSRLSALGLVLAAGMTTSAQQPTFRAGVTLVSTDVIPRDEKGSFVADLTKDNFTVLEDGQPQTIVAFSMVQGGRTYNLLTPPAADCGCGRPGPAAARNRASTRTSAASS